MFSNIIRPLAVALGAALALPVLASPLSRRDVIAPKITSPNAQSIWPVGSTQTVTWDTSNFPPVSQITNILGQVILGFQANDSLNLDFDHPLAQNFNLTDGSVNITVPNVTPRDDYLIVLFGDSGNTSPAFSITRISAPGGSSSSSSSLTSSSTTTSATTTTPATPSSGTETNPPSPPFTGTTITGGESTSSLLGSVTTQGAATDSSTDSAPSSTSTAPPSSSTTTSGTGPGTALGAGAASGARASGPKGFGTALCVGLGALSAFVML